MAACRAIVHLNELELTIFLPEVCHFLAQSTLKLDSFTSKISTEYSAPIVAGMLEALTAPCLKFLTRLSISIGPNSSFNVYTHANIHCTMVEPIFIAITNIESLQSLRLTIGMKPSWCQRFATLKNLKTLHLFPLFVEFDDSDTNETLDPDIWDPYGRKWNLHPRDCHDTILTALDSVFSQVPCKPRFTVHQHTYY